MLFLSHKLKRLETGSLTNQNCNEWLFELVISLLQIMPHFIYYIAIHKCILSCKGFKFPTLRGWDYKWGRRDFLKEAGISLECSTPFLKFSKNLFSNQWFHFCFVMTLAIWNSVVYQLIKNVSLSTWLRLLYLFSCIFLLDKTNEAPDEVIKSKMIIRHLRRLMSNLSN